MIRHFQFSIPTGATHRIRVGGDSIMYVSGTATLLVRPRLTQRANTDEGVFALLPGQWVRLQEPYDFLDIWNLDPAADEVQVSLNVGYIQSTGVVFGSIGTPESPVTPPSGAVYLFEDDDGLAVTRAGVNISVEEDIHNFRRIEVMWGCENFATNVQGLRGSTAFPGPLITAAVPLRWLHEMVLGNTYVTARAGFTQIVRVDEENLTATTYQVDNGMVVDPANPGSIYAIIGYNRIQAEE